MEKMLQEILEELRKIRGLLAGKSTLSNISASETTGENTSLELAVTNKNRIVMVLTKLTSFFKKSNSYLVPGAILLAGLLISGSLFFSKNKEDIAKTTGQTANIATQNGSVSDNVKAVTSQDHIRGDKNAPVKIVEFSDLQCPFCQKFHDTVLQAMLEFDGKVAWIYRHFPLESIHPRAKPQAIASECINELGGNDKFWLFIDNVFQTNQANSDVQLAQMAVDIGINRAKFETCLRSGKYDSLIADQTADAQASGGRGTPYTVIIAPNGKTFTVNGAQPYSVLKATIEKALQAK